MWINVWEYNCIAWLHGVNAWINAFAGTTKTAIWTFALHGWECSWTGWMVTMLKIIIWNRIYSDVVAHVKPCVSVWTFWVCFPPTNRNAKIKMYAPFLTGHFTYMRLWFTDSAFLFCLFLHFTGHSGNSTRIWFLFCFDICCFKMFHGMIYQVDNILKWFEQVKVKISIIWY